VPNFKSEEEQGNMFGVRASMEESFRVLVVEKLFLFRRLSIHASSQADLLFWWRCHENQFSNVGFLPK